jgi:uncharacterized protein YcbK (DUF882 family)
MLQPRLPSRRRFLGRLAIVASTVAIVGPRRAWSSVEARSLSFRHTHVDESLTVTYFENGLYLPSALDEIDHFLRDWRTGRVVSIDTGLLDVLWDLRVATAAREAIHVVCGYRSPQTNEMLRERSADSGVARNSQHVAGRAIDIRIPGVATTDLRDAALALGRGGVGYYAASDFVHVDTGRARRW